MHVYRAPHFRAFLPIRGRIAFDLTDTQLFNPGEWQSMDTSQLDTTHSTYELEDVTVHLPLPALSETDDAQVGILQSMFEPDLPWANQHFAERVSGQPLNPPPSHLDWPYAVRGNGDHTDQGKFSHTYPERFWPKRANPGEVMLFQSGREAELNVGIRFAYGDLSDVVSLLVASPGTRQAYLPVWFPEDTGGHVRIGARVPCSLGYHFMIRDGQLSTRYYIRSCDLYRHFTNDLYFAARLALWVASNVNYELDQGDATMRPMLSLSTLTTHIGSLHGFVADKAKLMAMVR